MTRSRGSRRNSARGPHGGRATPAAAATSSTACCGSRRPPLVGVAVRRRVVVDDELGDVGHLPSRGSEVVAEDLLLAAEREPRLEAAAARKASRRTIAAHAMNESSAWPGWPSARGSGVAASSSHDRVVALVRADEDVGVDERRAGGGRRAGRRRGRGAGRPPGVVVGEGDVRGGEPLHAMLRAARPGLRSERMTSTSGNGARTASAVPSVEPLSTTTTRGRSGSAVRWPRALDRSATRSRVMTTTETRGSKEAICTSPTPASAR